MSAILVVTGSHLDGTGNHFVGTGSRTRLQGVVLSPGTEPDSPAPTPGPGLPS